MIVHECIDYSMCKYVIHDMLLGNDINKDLELPSSIRRFWAQKKC